MVGAIDRGKILFLCLVLVGIFVTYIEGKTYSIKAVTPAVRHGEGPHWDERDLILYYVDTFNATVYRWNYQTKRISSYELENHNSVGIIVPIEGEKNQFLAGADRNVCRINWPKGLFRKTPEMSILGRVEVEKPKNQFNDGKVDNRGRVWIGTLTRNEDLSVLPKGGSLYMIKYGDTIEEEEKISNTSISNGIAWSDDNKKFYFVDSTPRTVTEYDYEEESGNISNGKIIFDLANHPELEGIPDGMTIDNRGNLWIALFKGHSVINVDPRTGEILNRLRMPVTYPTSVCFGGPQLDVLFVTTSREHLDEKQLREEPEAGSVFVVENLGVWGFPGNRAVSFN